MGFDTERWYGADVLVLPVAAGQTIRQGAIVVVHSGYAKEAPAGGSSAIAAGRAEHDVDNTGGANGDKTVEVRRGVFRLEADPADAPGQTELLKDVYLSGPNTVAKTSASNSRPKAGKLLRLEGGYAWVEVY